MIKTESSLQLLVINGPNLNLLGEREPEIYGAESLQDINDWLISSVAELSSSIKLEFFQSNHEGALIDFLQQYRHTAHGAVLNPGGLTHYSVALRDAISACQLPVVEVHLSNIHERENFRQVSMIKDVCIKQFSGLGKQGYLDAVKLLLAHLGG